MYLFSIGILLLASVSQIYIWTMLSHEAFLNHGVLWWSGVSLILLVAFGVGALSFLDEESVIQLVLTGRYTPSEVAEIRRDRVQIEDRLRQSDTNEKEWFDSLELNLNHISEYYAINKSQSRNSFRMGVAAVLLGWTALLTGIALLYHDPHQVSVGAITAIGGVMTQFIGASCFYLYNKARTQLEFFYEKLNLLQGNMLAVRLCEQVESAPLRDEIRRDIINSLIGSNIKRLRRPKPLGARAPIENMNGNKSQASPRASK